MPDDSDGKQTYDHVVAFIDILGSSQILKSDDEKAIEKYLIGIEGLYSSSQEHVTDNIKMFSDNILIYSESSSPNDVRSVVTSIAHIQWTVMKEFNLLIRGGVVIGRLDKMPEESSDYIIGRAIVHAHELESRHAIYPRVVVDEKIAGLYSGPIPLIKEDWDTPFIDYLQLSLHDGFVSDELIEYRQSLLEHIQSNNRLEGCGSDEWDRIRSKDIWAISYYNDFCHSNGCDDSIIDFREHYDPVSKRIVIHTEDMGGCDFDG